MLAIDFTPPLDPTLLLGLSAQPTAILADERDQICHQGCARPVLRWIG